MPRFPLLLALVACFIAAAPASAPAFAPASAPAFGPRSPAVRISLAFDTFGPDREVEATTWVRVTLRRGERSFDLHEVPFLPGMSDDTIAADLLDELQDAFEGSPLAFELEDVPRGADRVWIDADEVRVELRTEDGTEPDVLAVRLGIRAEEGALPVPVRVACESTESDRLLCVAATYSRAGKAESRSAAAVLAVRGTASSLATPLAGRGVAATAEDSHLLFPALGEGTRLRGFEVTGHSHPEGARGAWALGVALSR